MSCVVWEDYFPKAGLIFVASVGIYGLKNTLHFTIESHWSVLKQVVVWIKFLRVIGLQSNGPV